ncbi:MAG: adenosylcobalamin-dependent ribonucleoside-diphosphate reductase [Nitrososphaerales archaeon]
MSLVFKKELELPKETLDFFKGDELRARVFYEKYALRDERGNIVESLPPQMWRRVAREIASVEINDEKRREWEEKFYWLLEDFRFIPGGRILFGAGQKRRATLLNCYFIPIKEDSIEGIFDWCKEAARTYSFGGGVGVDISILRYKGAPVNNAAIYSTGSVSFMELMSITTGTIGQAGRRGALLITLRVDHPDIFDFIDIKRDLTKVNYANISVLVTDEFMKAVEEDKDFELKFHSDKASFSKKVKAREIWEKLVRASWESAEPGVLFWDTVKRESPSEYNGMEVKGFNPCSEQALEDYGSCCLGSVNLSSFVLNPFTNKARIDWENLEKAVRYGVRFLDNVLDYNASRHPLRAQRDASLYSRRIGLGFTGLADMLIKLNMKYDEDETIEFVGSLFEKIKNISYDESCNLAEEKGNFPGFDLNKHLERDFVKRLEPKIVERIKEKGLRNVCILTIPPVGSGSILAGTSSGIEPLYAISYVRRSKSLTEQEFKVYHPLVKEYMGLFKVQDEKDLPPTFIPAYKIKPEQRVKMQAMIQRHIDSSISSTVNLPQDIKVEEVEKIFFLAWKLGCKGITVYREGSREGILVKEKEAKKEIVKKWERPRILIGETIKFRLPQGGLYVTVNRDEEGIKEVFVTLGKSGADDKANSEAIGRLISLFLQKGGDIKDVIKSLKGIQGESSSWDHGLPIYSVPDAVAKALEMFSGIQVEIRTKLSKCPQCGQATLSFEEGCYKCLHCGYTKCF